MASKLTVLFSFLLLLQNLQSSAAQSTVKAAYWFPDSYFPVSSIDSSLFTVLYCAFAQLDPQTFQVYIRPQDADQFASFTSTVQSRNPSIKTLLSIGGGETENKEAYPIMASDWNRRQAFIQSSIRLARANNFHGLDLDWEYPSNTTQMTQFGYLVDEWRMAVADEASSTGRTPLLLSAAVFYSSNYYSAEYVVPALARSLDWINVMAYDFYGPSWSNVTGPPAALYNPWSQVSGDSGITAWISSGFPANKIVFGFPFFGYRWTLSDPGNHGYFAPTTNSSLDGALTYRDIRQFITNNGAATVYNSAVVGDYCYSGTAWIGYDDYQSIVTKVRYIKGKGLRGYFAWHVGADDNAGLARAAWQTWESGTTHRKVGPVNEVKVMKNESPGMMNWWNRVERSYLDVLARG